MIIVRGIAFLTGERRDELVECLGRLVRELNAYFLNPAKPPIPFRRSSPIASANTSDIDCTVAESLLRRSISLTAREVTACYSGNLLAPRLFGLLNSLMAIQHFSLRNGGCHGWRSDACRKRNGS